MEFLTIFITICVVNVVLFFTDTVFKTCSHYPYITFLHSTGLTIGIFKITLFTKVFNKTLQKLSSYKPKVLDMWFRLGVVATLFLLPLSIAILMMSIGNLIQTRSLNNHDGRIILQPVVPGINLPIADCSYYLFTIVISSIIHEIGHALAALREEVHISGIGFSTFLLVPIAYVKMNSDQLRRMNPVRQLRIFCAGIWNNIALAFTAYSFLIVLPSILSPIYDLGKGVTVLDVYKSSQIAGKSGVAIGDKLVAINDCEVFDTDSWNHCLKSFNNKPSPGFCINADIIHELDQSVPLRTSEGGTVECCDEKSDRNLCFETLDGGKPLQIPQYSCLPGRPVIENTSYMCRTPKDCPSGLHCVRPVTPHGMTLLRIKRSHGKMIIFIGKPNNVMRAVDVSDYSKKFKLFPPRLAEALTKLTKYFIILSAGIAIVNSVPCFYFDGNHITYAIIRYFLPRSDYKALYSMLLNIFGTVLIATNFSCILWLTILKLV